MGSPSPSLSSLVRVRVFFAASVRSRTAFATVFFFVSLTSTVTSSVAFVMIFFLPAVTVRTTVTSASSRALRASLRVSSESKKFLTQSLFSGMDITPSESSSSKSQSSRSSSAEVPGLPIEGAERRVLRVSRSSLSFFAAL